MSNTAIGDFEQKLKGRRRKLWKTVVRELALIQCRSGKWEVRAVTGLTGHGDSLDEALRDLFSRIEPEAIAA